MDIRKYQPTAVPAELISLLRKKYGNEKNIEYFIADFNKSFDFCLNNKSVVFQPIAGYEGDQMVAHIALIVDKRLATGEAFFGFLEVSEDEQDFKIMWEALTKEARSRDISILKGPVNGSIWHQYRCVKETDGSPFFKAELFAEPYYYQRLVSINPAREMAYYSASRDRFEALLPILQAGEPIYKKLGDAGFFIKEIKHVALKELQAIAALSRMVFHNSWGYTELTENEFIALYSSDKLDEHLGGLYLLYKDDNIVGFCGTLKEDENTLICKTICVLPEYQGMGLGNALAYKIHVDAQEKGIKKIIYALIREGNNIKNFPQVDTVIFRRYTSFEFHI
jgi:ribosomal protein S18 acetylase RimI-like enzyme